jgi:membrane-bound lytic murein transglycosylase D
MKIKYLARRLVLLFTFLVLGIPEVARAETNPTKQELFPVLPGLEKPVEFWKRIFAEFTLSQIVFFDPLDMGKVYEVLHVGEEIRSKDFITGERTRIAAAHGVEVERVRAQRGIKERMAAGLKRAGRYLPLIQQTFRERGLPAELGYLPLVESSFDINARSHAGALGMWQFMRATGRQYMRVERHIDERRDPIASTRAAASFLSQSYQLLGNWPLAITSYNYGPAGLARAVAQVESDNLVDLIRDYKHPNWGFPPKNFYAEFLAAMEIAKNLDLYFPGLDLDSPIEVREIELKKSTSLSALAKMKGLTEEQLLLWNPALTKKTRSVPAGYLVKVPVEGRAEAPLQTAQNSEPKTEPEVVRHRVKRGETVMQIARRYGASVERILELNRIHRPHLVKVGTLLLIPKS